MRLAARQGIVWVPGEIEIVPGKFMRIWLGFFFFSLTAAVLGRGGGGDGTATRRTKSMKGTEYNSGVIVISLKEVFSPL
jgi:hypothetical protein